MKAKYIYQIVLIPFLGALLSCSKFLNVEPKDNTSDAVTIVDETSANTALNGVYEALASAGYYGQTFQFTTYLRGGDLEWGDSRTVNREFIQRDVRADNEEVNNVWVAIYRTINRANHVIKKVPALPDDVINDTKRDQITGEAYFIRALAYFDLARVWGGVQLILEPTESLDASKGIPRSSLQDTYAQVLSDLNEAEQRLPETTNRVRATKKTVWALKARYYLYQQQWAEAENYATKLIDDSQYELIKPYSSWFANNVVGARESILETTYNAANPNNHRTAWQPPANGGVRRWYPSDAFIQQITDPAIGGGRKALVAQSNDGSWYGNLYYRTPAVDPSYILRIAEMYLIRAEARAHQAGKRSLALADLNAVRDRAELLPLALSDEQELLLAIEKEKHYEFAFEPHYWFDLVRTGRVGAVLNVTDPNKYVLPIPIAQLLVDPALTPNPGY